MRKPTVNKVAVETWVSKNHKTTTVSQKIVVRNHLGQFHGATNYRGTVISATVRKSI